MDPDSSSDKNEDDSWVDDVVSRAIAKSYSESPKFQPPEENLPSDKIFEEDAEGNSPSVISVSPYPDESPEAILNAPQELEEPARKSGRRALEWLAVVVGALLVALLIKTFLMQAYYIPSSSMTPTLQVGDRVLVNKLSYEFSDISRGDLIVFQKSGENTVAKADLIKRVIALEGELIEITEGRVYIIEKGSSTRKLLEEPYLSQGVLTNSLVSTEWCLEATENSCLVPEGHLFVMGDNRAGSRDSRYFGPISESDVVGRAFIRLWPLGSLKLL